MSVLTDFYLVQKNSIKDYLSSPKHFFMTKVKIFLHMEVLEIKLNLDFSIAFSL